MSHVLLLMHYCIIIIIVFEVLLVFNGGEYFTHVLGIIKCIIRNIPSKFHIEKVLGLQRFKQKISIIS